MEDANKTQPTIKSVEEFIASIEDKQRQSDSRQLVGLIHTLTGVPPVMWSSSIVGFGTNHYKYASGREGDTAAVGFAPRKDALVLYGVIYYDQNLELAEKLGPHKAGKGCLYIKKLADIDTEVLKQMVKKAFKRNNT